jgi:hypothetical protein
MQEGSIWAESDGTSENLWVAENRGSTPFKKD